MDAFLLTLAGVFALLTLVSLIAGIVGMAGGGVFNSRYGNLFMRGRIVFQAVTLLLLLAVFAT